jgi:hypothetical protein
MKSVYNGDHNLLINLGPNADKALNYKELLNNLGFDDTNSDSFQTMGLTGYLLYYGESLTVNGQKRFYIINLEKNRVEAVFQSKEFFEVTVDQV